VATYYSPSEILQKFISASGQDFSPEQIAAMEQAISDGSYSSVMQTIADAPASAFTGPGDLVLYSGPFTNPDGTVTPAYQAANALADATGGYTMGDTTIGNTVSDAIGNLGSAEELGLTDAMQSVLNNTAWGYASQELVANADGNVNTVLGDVNEGSVFAQVEANAIVSNVEAGDGLTSVNLNPVTSEGANALIDANGNANLDAFNSSEFSLAPEVNQALADGTLTPEAYADLRDSLLSTPGAEDSGIAPNPDATNIGDTPPGELYNNTQLGVQDAVSTDLPAIEQGADPVDYYPQGGEPPAGDIPVEPGEANSALADAGSEILNNEVNQLVQDGDVPSTPETGPGGTELPDAASLLSAEGALGAGLEALGAIGLGVIAYQTGEQIGTAINQVIDGDYTGAAQTMTDLAGSLAGGFAGAEVGAELGAEAGALAGPIGALLGGAIGGGLGYFAGSQTGQALANSLFNFFNNLGSELNNALQDIENLPQAIQNALNNLFHARHDPLIVDLTGNGLNIESETAIGAPYFDFSGGNLAVKTAWAGAGNGFLVIKSDNPAYGVSIGNGYELLGTGSAAGFALLQSLVSGGATALDASNPNFALLGVWDDVNGDGVAESSEIFTLPQLGIVSISLATIAANETIAGSAVQQVSTVTFANGNSTEIAQVDLAYNPVDTKYTGSFTESAQVAALPNVKGFGDVPNLAIAMSLNATLATMVQDLAQSPPASQTAFDQSIQDIMYEWAGVSSVSAAAGNIFDGQKVDFLADFTPYSTPFSTNPSVGPAPWFPGQAISLNGTWNQIFDMVESQFLLQVNPAFYSNFTYSPTAGDAILPATGDLSTTLRNLAASAPSDPTGALNYWVQALIIANESASDIGRVQAAVGAANTPYTVSVTGDPAWSALFPSYFSADILAAAQSGTLTYIEMSALKNVVYGTPGADLYDVSTPNQKIIGYGGGDEIIVGPGAANLEINEVENNPSNTNVLFFAPGISESNIIVTDDTNGDLIITYDAQGDQVTLDNMVFGPASGGEQGPLHTSLPYTPDTEFGVQEVVFADGTTLSAQQVLAMLQNNGSPTSPVLDSGDASETLDPRGYAHTVIGAGGLDTILYGEGYGDLTIIETTAPGAEQSVLQFGSGIALADLDIGADAAGDLLIALNTTGNTITLTGMNASDSAGVAEAVFASGTTLSASQLLTLEATGTAENTALYANSAATLYDPAGFAHSVTGLTAGDTVIYNQGYGDLTIAQASGATLAFGSAVSAADIVVSQDAGGDVIFTDLPTGSQIIVQDMASGQYSGLAAVTFADGTTLTPAAITALADTGSAHNSTIYSFAGNTINTQGAATYVQGSGNGDTILYNPGYGNLTIYEQGAAGLFGPGPLYASLQFGQGITESEIAVASDASNDILLEVGTTGSVITLKNMLQFGQGGFFSSNDGVTAISFADGTTFSAPQIVELTAIGSAVNTTIHGAALDTTIDPAGFAHVIDGTGGASTILYNANYGNLLIEESDYGSPPTTLALGSGISETGISVSYAGTSYYGEQQDLVLSLATGAAISIDGAGQIAAVDFADGTVWDTATLLALADIAAPGETVLTSDSSNNVFDPKGYAHTINTGYNETDTIIYNAGYGPLTLNEQEYYYSTPTTIQFGAGISESGISAVNLGQNTFILDIGTGADQITINGFTQIAAITFADGTTWSPSVVLSLADTGTPFSQTLVSDSAQNVFNPNGDAHVILAGANETDTVLYGLGDGGVTIEENTNSPTTIEFGAGVTAADITVTNISPPYGGAPTLVIGTGTLGQSLTIANATQLVALDFADGTSLSAAALFALADSAQPGQTTLVSDSTSNVFNPNGNAHTILNYGGQGSDTILYTTADGDLTISDDTEFFDSFNSAIDQYQYGYYANNNVLQFDSGITAAELSASQDDFGDLLLTISGTGAVITLTNEAIDPPAGSITTQSLQFGIAQAVFADGTTLSSQQLIGMSEVGSPTNTFITALTPTTFVANGYVQVIHGSGEDDVIAYGSASGNLTIVEYGPYGTPASSILQLGSGISPNGVLIGQDGNGDVLLDIVSTGTTITIEQMADAFTYGDVNEGLGAVAFADGTTWSAAYIGAQLQIPSAFNTSLYSDTGGNTFNSQGIATYIQDYDGPNTYVYDSGYGHLTIEQTNYDGAASAQSVLQFGPGISSANLGVTTDGQGNLLLTDGIAGDALTLDGMFGYSLNGVGSVAFADGTSLTAAQLLARAAVGSPENTTLYSDYLDDTLNPNGFAQLIVDYGKDQIVYATADGNLTIESPDNVYGGAPDASTLKLAAGITEANVAFSLDANDDVLLSIAPGLETITFAAAAEPALNGNIAALPMPTILFADGTEISGAQAVAAAIASVTVLGGTGADTITAAADGFVIGNGGADTILYPANGGNLDIKEQLASGTEQSVLQFGSGFSAADLTVSADTAGDLFLELGTLGGVVTLAGMLDHPNAGVAAVRFADGTSLSAAALAALVQTGSPETGALYAAGGVNTLNPAGYASQISDIEGGTDTIDYAAGDGNVYVDEINPAGAEQSVLAFGSGITPDDLTVTANLGDLIITDGVAGDELDLYNMASNADFGVGGATFLNGVTLSRAQLLALEPAPVPATITATPFETTLYAVNETGANIFDPAGYARQVYDNYGGYNTPAPADTILYNTGYGNLEISEFSAAPEQSVLAFGAGITPGDVVFSVDPGANGGAGIRASLLGTGASIVLDGMASSPDDGVGSVTFADGTVLTAAQILQQAETGSANNTILYPVYGNSVLNPDGAAHTVLDAGAGDTVLYDLGYGNLSVDTEYSPDSATLQLGAGIELADLAISKDAYGDLTVVVGASGTVTLNGFLDGGAGLIAFADGTSLTPAQANAITDTGSATNTTLVSGESLPNLFNPNGFAHSVSDPFGLTDTILYAPGDGDLTIAEIGGTTAASVLQFGAGIAESAITVTADAAGDLLVAIGTTGALITLTGMAASPNQGVGSFVFADGTTLAAAQLVALDETGTPGVTTLTGSYGNCTFAPDGFAHVIDGGAGVNTILYAAGDGDITINETAAAAEQSVLQFGAGIAASAISAISDAAGDIILSIATLGTQITLTGMLNSLASGIGSLEFADGMTLSAQQVIALSETGSPTNTTLSSTYGGEVINPNGAAHTVNGLGGPDVINYSLGDGNLTINEVSYYNPTLTDPSGYPFSYDTNAFVSTGPDQAVLQFGAGIALSDISASASGDNIILTVGATGSQITLTNMVESGQLDYLYGEYPYFYYAGVGAVSFADGVTLSAAQVQDLLHTGSAGNATLTATAGTNTLTPGGFAHVINGDGGTDTILYDTGDGNLLINETNASGPEQSVLQIGSALAAADFVISADATGDILLTDTATGAIITLTGMLDSSGQGVGSVVFADPSTLSAAQIDALAETGSPENTTLYGAPDGATLFTAGFAQLVQGEGGADVIVYTPSQTELEINEQSSGPEASVLQFGAGITAADVTVATDGFGDVLLSLGAAGLGGVIDLTNMLNGTSYGVSALEFADGTTLSAAQIDAEAGGIALAGATLYSTLDNATLDTKGFYSTVQGNGGDDTIVYNAGYGNLTIIEQNPAGPEQSVLTLGVGISPDQVSVTQDANGDILLNISAPAAVITLSGMVSSDENGVAAVEFADGTTWTAQQVIAMTETGSANNTTLTAGPGNNTFNAAGAAHQINGDGGADTIIYDQGYGPLTVNEENATGTEQSVLQFGPGLSAAAMIASQDAFGDILLTLDSAGDIVTLSSMLDSGENGIAFGIGTATFMDGTALTAQQLINLAETGSAGNTVLHAGPDSGTIDPAGFAHLVEGNAGPNTVIYNTGYGGLTINEQIAGASAASVLQFGSGFSAASLAFTEDKAGDVLITIGGTGSQITLTNMANTGAGGIADGVGNIDFTGGTSLSAAQIISLASAAAPVASVFTGLPGTLSTTDEAALALLAGFSIADTNSGAPTESVIITPTSTANGKFADPSFATDGAMLVAGAFTITGSASLVSSVLDGLLFTPTAHQVAPGSTVATSFLITDENSDGLTSAASFTVAALAVNDPPAITGALSAQAVTDEAAIKPFVSLSVTDPDFGVSDSATITLTGTSGLATDANGLLSGTGVTKTGTGLYALSATTPASLTSELAGLTFSPTAHQVAPGASVVTDFDLTVTQGGTFTSNTATSVIAAAMNDAPTISGALSAQAVTDAAAIKPFARLSATDPDFGASDSAMITLTGTSGVATDADGLLSGTGLTKTGTGLYTLAAASPAGLTSELDGLTFTPTAHQVSPGASVVTGFDLTITQGGTSTSNSTASVISTAVNDAPSITGAKPGQATSDTASLKPFFTVNISDPDFGASDSAMITLTGTSGVATDADGLLSGTGLTKTGTGLYTLSATTPGSLTAELDALTFTPTAHQVAPGFSVVTEFDLTVSQGATASTSTLTSVIATNETQGGTTITNGTLVALSAGQTLNTGGTLHAISGGSFANTIIYNTGYGQLTINDSSPAGPDGSVLQLGAGITESGLAIAQDSAGDILLTIGSATITLDGMATTSAAGVADITFADGTSWSAAEVVELAALRKAGTLPAVHSLAYGIGNVTISGAATLVVPRGTPKANVIFQSNNNNGNLTVALLGTNGLPTGDAITIAGYYWNENNQAQIVFSDGTKLTLGNALEDTWIGSTTSTTLTGSDFTPNLFELGAGGDTITLGATYDGGNGQNTIDFGDGDGIVTVNPNQAGGTIAFGPGITAADVIFESNNNNGNLTVELLNAAGTATGDAMTIDGYWYNGTKLNEAVFAGGTTLALNHQLTNTWIGTAANTTLTGSDFTPNVFNLGAGGDHVTLGANYDGGNGENVINFGTGDGAVTITGNQGLADVDLAAGIGLTDVTLTTDAAHDIILALANGTDKLVFLNSVYNDSFQGLTFASGATLSESQILATAQTGTTGNDTISAAAGAVVDGRGGNDVITGAGKDTYIYRAGYGNLTINNGGGTAANGALDFGPGITEQDLWFSQTGNNLDINMLGSKNQIALDNWFGGNKAAQLSEIISYDGLEIDTGLNKLIAAMAAFETGDSGFNPETAQLMPTNTALDAAIATAWHS
jgi:hypothetical protein